MANIIYSPKDIFEQEFKISMRGFDRAEVDEFLDNVISDYELFLAEIENLKAENAKLKEQIKAFEVSEPTSEPPRVIAAAGRTAYSAPLPGQAVVPAANSTGPAPTEKIGVTTAEPKQEAAANTVTNFDILRRLSRLEKEVFGKQIVE